MNLKNDLFDLIFDLNFIFCLISSSDSRVMGHQYYYCFVFIISYLITLIFAQFQWQQRDSFDEVRKKLDEVNEENCKIVDVNKLFLPSATVTHIPDLIWLGQEPLFPNRTNLLHIHNIAMSRAFYYRYHHTHLCWRSI